MSFGFATTGDEIVDTFASQVRGKICKPTGPSSQSQSNNTTVLITGPSEGGIGAETSLCLARANPKHLILAGRSQSKIDPVISRIQIISPSTQTTYLPLDLSSQPSILTAVSTLKSLLDPQSLDILINNAAIMACPYSTTTLALTNTQCESQLATNHLGPFLLTNLLLKDPPVLSPSARVINVNSSASNRLPSTLLPPLLNPAADLTYAGGATYNPWTAYSVSKAASLLTSRHLAQRLRHSGANPNHNRITVFAPHPGSIRSGLQQHLTPSLVAEAVRLATQSDPNFTFPPPKTLQQGCATVLWAALDPGLEGESGAYLENCAVVETECHRGMYGAAERVWEVSERAVGEGGF